LHGAHSLSFGLFSTLDEARDGAVPVFRGDVN
jgi:hypothetical protein